MPVPDTQVVCLADPDTKQIRWLCVTRFSPEEYVSRSMTGAKKNREGQPFEWIRSLDGREPIPATLSDPGTETASMRTYTAWVEELARRGVQLLDGTKEPLRNVRDDARTRVREMIGRYQK